MIKDEIKMFEFNGNWAKMAGKDAEIAHGINLRNCKYTALCPSP